MTEVILYGAAKKRFGGPFRLNVDTIPDAIRALCSRLKAKGFKEFLEAGYWRVIRGDRQRGLQLDERMLKMPIGKVRELHLIPVASGSGKGKGIGKIVAGVALVAASFIPGLQPIAGGLLTSAMFGVGVSIGLAGVSSLIAPTPKVQSYGDRERQKPSALFNGTINMTEPGAPRPIAYGREVAVGSVVVSAGLSVEQLGTSQ